MQFLVAWLVGVTLAFGGLVLGLEYHVPLMFSMIPVLLAVPACQLTIHLLWRRKQKKLERTLEQMPVSFNGLED